MRYIILLSLLFVQATHADGTLPWFTGPLLTPSARVVKVGHFLVEPYFNLTFINGRYQDDWSLKRVPTTTQVNPLSLVSIGMTETMNFTAILQGFCNSTQKRTSVSFGDLPLRFEIELYNEGGNFIKLFLQEVFPTGKFQKLEREKFGTDAGGQGSFQTLPGLGLGKMIHICGVHYLSLRAFFNGGLGSPVQVKGFNAYGGDPTTVGTIYRGPTFNALFGAEYSLTENWALALDVAGIFAGRHKFKGTTITPTGFPPSAQFSLAPAIEYNIDEHIGIIAGCWFTVAGKNANQFICYSTAVNIYY